MLSIYPNALVCVGRVRIDPPGRSGFSLGGGAVQLLYSLPGSLVWRFSPDGAFFMKAVYGPEV
jgi:hypothetical protein